MCETCNLRLTSLATLRQHLAGRRHLRAVARGAAMVGILAILVTHTILITHYSNHHKF